MPYPTTLVEAICFPVGAFIGQCWQQVTHPSAHAMICLGMVVSVSLRAAVANVRAARASKTAP